MRVVVKNIEELSGHEENAEEFVLDLRTIKKLEKLECFVWDSRGARCTVGQLQILDMSGNKKSYPSEDAWHDRIKTYMRDFFYLWPEELHVAGLIVTVKF